jgi:hypothetical protein
VTPSAWHERYDRRVEDARLPEAGPKRDTYAAQVGTDGFRLLDALDKVGAPSNAVAPPAVGLLRRVWARHFERTTAKPGSGGASGGARLRPVRDVGPGGRVESPYDAEARFRTKRGANWTGYMVHLTESCDEGKPRLLLHADTTPANVADAVRLSPIHEALVAKGLTPSEHLVDAAYVSADHFVAARERHGIDLVGPARPDPSWQSRDGAAFGAGAFAVDWDRRLARCPEGKESTGWAVCGKAAGGSGFVHTHFRAEDCRACPSRARCTRSRDPYQGRVLTLLARGASMTPSRLPGRERAPVRAGGFTRCARESRARCRRRSVPAACAGRASADWPRRACSTSPPPPRSTSTAWRSGSADAHSHPPEPRVSPPLPHERRVRQQCPTLCPLYRQASAGSFAISRQVSGTPGE